MESIGSASGYTSIIEDLLLDDVNMIRKNAILQHQGQKLGIATSVANELTQSMTSDGYQFDAEIPEGSTFSIHI